MKGLCFAGFIFIAFHCVAVPELRAQVCDMTDDLDAPRFEISTESSYLMGIIGNPNSYEIGAQFLTGRIRWGAVAQRWLVARFQPGLSPGHGRADISRAGELLLRHLNWDFATISLGQARA